MVGKISFKKFTDLRRVELHVWFKLDIDKCMAS
jgi:hypothetical protein